MYIAPIQHTLQNCQIYMYILKVTFHIVKACHCGKAFHMVESSKIKKKETQRASFYSKKSKSSSRTGVADAPVVMP